MPYVFKYIYGREDDASKVRQLLQGQGKAAGELADFAANFFEAGGVVAAVHGVVHQVGDVEHLFIIHAARRHGRSADADAAGFEDGVGVEGDAVRVHGDAGAVERR
jgi:hypothetical protein